MPSTSSVMDESRPKGLWERDAEAQVSRRLRPESRRTHEMLLPATRACSSSQWAPLGTNGFRTSTDPLGTAAWNPLLGLVSHFPAMGGTGLEPVTSCL